MNKNNLMVSNTTAKMLNVILKSRNLFDDICDAYEAINEKDADMLLDEFYPKWEAVTDALEGKLIEVITSNLSLHKDNETIVI